MRSATTGKNYVRWRGEGGGNCKMRPALHSSKTMGFYPVGKSGLSDLNFWFKSGAVDRFRHHLAP